MYFDFLSYSHSIIWEPDQFLSIVGGGGVSLMLGGYAKGKSPSFKSPEAEYGYVISTVFFVIQINANLTVKQQRDPLLEDPRNLLVT